MNISGEIKEGALTKVDLDLITGRIIGCAHAVSNALGTGFIEKVYENAHAHEMRKAGLKVLQQHPISVMYDGIVAGEFFADMLVEDAVLVELKAIPALTDAHMAQALNYMRATGFSACLLINFGQPRLQIRRLHPSPAWKPPRI